VDRIEAMKVAASDASVSNKIRALDAAGYPRAEIAKLLSKRYQHVRNVLEGDKLRVPPTGGPSAGLAESGRQFSRSQSSPDATKETEAPSVSGGLYRLEVEEGGVVRLPPAVLAALKTSTGGVLISELGEDRLTLLSPHAAMAKVDALLAPFRWRGGPFVSDDLIAERRSEAARDANG
jgi:hypothetical protein